MIRTSPQDSQLAPIEKHQRVFPWWRVNKPTAVMSSLFDQDPKRLNSKRARTPSLFRRSTSSDLSHWRKRLGGKLEILLAESLRRVLRKHEREVHALAARLMECRRMAGDEFKRFVDTIKG
jgi:hypothetical protein